MRGCDEQCDTVLRGHTHPIDRSFQQTHFLQLDHQFMCGVLPGLAQDVAPVRVHGVHAEEDLFRDLVALQALRDHAQDLQLTFGEHQSLLQ